MNVLKSIEKNFHEMNSNNMKSKDIILQYFKNKYYFPSLFIEYWLENFAKINDNLF